MKLQSGTLAMGAAEYWTWHNAPASAVFEATLVPHNASTASECTMRVERTWYVKTPAGERQFRFKIVNTTPSHLNVSCQGQILLNWATPGTSWNSGTLSPGASTSKTWKNANPSQVYLVGLNPISSSSTANCAIEVTRVSYARQTTGQIQYKFTLKNVGSVACVTAIQLAWLDAVDTSSWWLSDSIEMEPGRQFYLDWDDSPLSPGAVYVPGLKLKSNSTAGPCQMLIRGRTFSSYRFSIDEWHAGVRTETENTGNVNCTPSLLMAKM